VLVGRNALRTDAAQTKKTGRSLNRFRRVSIKYVGLTRFAGIL